MTARSLPSVTIRPNVAKLYLRECLTAKQMRVEIYEPEDGAGGKKNNSKWILAKAASPGNITQVEDLLFDNEDFVGHAVIMALKVSVKEGSRVIGAAFIDTQERMLGVSEYVDDDLYGNTEVRLKRTTHRPWLTYSPFSSSFKSKSACSHPTRNSRITSSPSFAP